jgi:hypothetical protein
MRRGAAAPPRVHQLRGVRQPVVAPRPHELDRDDARPGGFEQEARVPDLCLQVLSPQVR